MPASEIASFSIPLKVLGNAFDKVAACLWNSPNGENHRKVIAMKTETLFKQPKCQQARDGAFL